MELVESAYRLTHLFPAEERFGLISQLQRAAVSIPANIAEGWGRTHRGDYLRHLSIARGSLMEVETHLLLAMRQNFVAKEDVKPCWDQAKQVGKMLTAMIASMQQSEPSD
jgi:four helix bundle protein